MPVQESPDPAFPTLKFPNPEEAGTLVRLDFPPFSWVSLFMLIIQDESFAIAEANGARLVVANDPDADRLGGAERGYEYVNPFPAHKTSELTD